MKITILFLLFLLTTFGGKPQQPIPIKFKSITEPIKTTNDSLERFYYREAKRTDPLTNRLIAKTNRLQENNLQLLLQIKKLKKLNETLKNNKDTVYIRDTIFKKRRFFLF